MDKGKGFTLLEVAIVILVIGVIAGGIMAGQEMILSARDRNVAKQFQQYALATMAFKNKYNCIPGDCAKASQLGLGGNGDGDGLIFYGYGTSMCLEAFQFWQHLGNAELITGKYTGTWSWADGSYFQVNGINGPLVKGEDSKWGFWALSKPYFDYAGSSSLAPPRPEGISLAITKFNTGGGQLFVMSGWRAQQLDQKMDDGFPFSGNVVFGGHSNCINAWPVNLYKPKENGILCTISYEILRY